MYKDNLAFYKEYKEKVAAYTLLLNTMSFDQSTIAPKNGAAFRNKSTSIIAGELFSYQTNKDNIDKIEALYNECSDPVLHKELQLLLKDLDEVRNVPKDLYVKFRKVTADSMTYWEEAKNASDYEIFKPYLKEVVALQKEMLSYGSKSGDPYDIMLDRFEEGMNMEKYDAFFSMLKEHIVPLIKEIQDKGKTIDDAILHEKYDVEKQAEFAKYLQEYLGVNPRECYLGTTEHPFTSCFSSNDVRITTHYYEEDVLAAILSTVHEYGHALFDLQTNPEYDGSTLMEDKGMAMHESQSRFLENHIGRSKGFWAVNLPKLQEVFPVLKDVSLDDFVDMVNIACPSLVRTEADELTYPLHIMVRYEIEKMIYHDAVDFDELPKIWADKYEEYLGVRPQSDKEGILQDIHWSDGSFGYFPTYALGSAFAAQFYSKMEKDMDVDAALRNDFSSIKQWLKDNIHHYGALKNAYEIIEEVTGEEFNPKYYVEYLTNKFRKVYGLDEK